MNTVLSMSLNASLVIIFTVLARLLLKKAPKVFSYVLWIVVLFRLLCPITAQSDISLFNIVGFEPADNEIVTEVIYASFIPDTPDHVDTLTPDTVVPAVPDNDTTTESDENKDIIINYQPIIPEVNTDEDTVPTTVTVNTILRNIWLVGMSAMVIYSVLSLNMVKRKLFNAMPLKENIYVSQNILTPFVIGIIKPKIYLPVHIGEEEQRYIILHEKYHIKRFDHIAKLLFFTALVIHWFNPLVWLAFDLFTKDMEMSCDEAVMKQIGEDIKADYASSLLSLATGKSYFSPSPLAFSERDTKARIINISKWKKPKTIMIIFAAVAIMITCAMFITDPVDVSNDLAGAEYKAVKVLYDEKYTHGDYIEEVYTASLPTFHVTANKHLYVSKPDDADLWTYVGELEKSELTTKDIKGYTYVENAWVNRNDIKKITDCYIVHGEDAEFYNVFTTKNGKTYVGYGWEDVRERGQQGSDDTFFRYIYEVGSTLTKDSINYTFFDHCIECITKSEVNTFSITFAVNDFAVLGFVSGEQDNMDDMGYAVLRSHNNRTGFDMLAFRLYEGAAQTDSKIHFADPFTVSENGTATAENTYDVILSANKNLGSTKRIMTYADGSTKEMELLSIGSPYCMAVFPHANEKDAVMVSTVFYDKLENAMYDVTTKAVRSDGTDDPFGKVYYIADVVYQSGNEDAKNTDQISSFLLGSDHVLYIPDATSSSGYSPAGKFEEFKFAPATFDEYFKDKTGWQNFPHSAEWIREHKLTAYKLENEGTFYYLITTENGGIYLTCGNSADAYPEIDENAYMHYAVSLSQTGEVTNAIISEGAYIYVAPHVSTTVEDLPPYIFTMNDDSFYLERDGDIIAGNSPFEWQEFPWTEEEWENMFMIDCPASMRSLKEKYAEVGYMPLSGRYFILKVASQIWVADKPDKLISTVFVAKEYASASLAFSPGASAYQFTRYITAGDINNTQINFHYEPSTSVSGSLTRKELDSLIKVLNEIDESAVTEGTGRYDAWLSLFSANREIILRYDKELRRISFGFDTETSALYGDRQWMTEDEDLCRWFDEHIEKNGEDLAFINADSPYHTMKNLWKDFATTKTLTQKDNEGNRISTRDLTEAEYSTLFNIITDLPKESYEKGEMSSEYIAELRYGFEHAFYFGYTPGEDRILLSGEWETMQLFGGTDWIISSDEFVKYFEKLVK